MYYLRIKMQLEAYVNKIIDGGHRSILAQLRRGIYINIALEYQLCLMCSANKVADEDHLLLGICLL